MRIDDRGAAIHASADPARVAVVLERLGGSTLAGLDDATTAAVVAVAGASDSLGDLLAEDPRAIDVLTDLERPVAVDASSPGTLARTHRAGLLRLAARDLLGIDDLATTVAGLSALAVDAVRGALELTGSETLTVVGMGKLGAGELNVVSDVDVVLVSSGDPVADDRAARRFLDVAGRCFTVDTGLRPQGRDGPLVRSLASYRAHWERWASAWEFQALLKARPLAGPGDVGEAFADAASDALWGRPFDAESLREVRRLKARAEADIEARGLADREVKRGRGGIRDIEFSVQLLQLVHGGADPLVRSPATLEALGQLAAGGYVAEDEAGTLERAYEFLRRVEHRLQLVQERQTHTVPVERDRRRRLARTLGFRGDTDAGPTERFDRALAMHRLAVRRVHEGWYFRPLLDAFAGAGGPSHDISDARLEAFGFRDANRTRQAVHELASGLTRSSRLMRQLLPLVLDWLSSGPDPDLGLLGLRRLADGERRSRELVGSFRDSAETAQRLCTLLTTTPLATEVLLANPDLVERLDDASALATLDRGELLASAWQAVGWRDDADRRGALRRWFQRHLFGIVARDLSGATDLDGVGRDLTALVEAVLETAVRMVRPGVPFAVVGMGRMGGSELSYSSDVDLVFVHDGRGVAGVAEAERAATALLRLLGGTTPASRILTVDPDLRPEGKHGPLARSLESYTVYLGRWADVWERQALLRARVVAGDVDVGRGFDAIVDHALWTRPPTDEDRRDIRRMKARVEGERIPRGIEARRHLKLGPGGLADVEWTVQLAQWTWGIRRQATRDALGHLASMGVLDESDAAVLDHAHRTLDRLRNRTWMVFGDGDVLPERADHLVVLARAMATGGDDPMAGGGATALLEEHRRVTRRARRVVERVFYDAD